MLKGHVEDRVNEVLSKSLATKFNETNDRLLGEFEDTKQHYQTMINSKEQEITALRT